MDIQIRPAKPDDWKIIQYLNNQVFQSDKENDEDLILNWPYLEIGINYYKRLANGKYGKCVIAYNNDKPVGYVAMAIKNFHYRKSKYVEIENIGVEPEFRSQGIGKLLMDEVASWAKLKGATKLYVEAFWKNNKAIEFYKRDGFSEIGLQLERKV